MRRPTPEDINKPFEQPCEPTQRCQHPGCPEAGEYRAPVARDRLTEYYWFCVEHVREYNLAWDFFVGMNEAEIEQQRRADTVWQRPSWPLGQFGERARFRADYRVHDAYDFFSEETASAHQKKPKTEEQKALAILDLKEPVTFGDVKNRYKSLVKQLHPDTNDGDREAEERLKTVNLAYAALKMSFA